MSRFDRLQGEEFEWLLGARDVKWVDLTDPDFLVDFEVRQSGPLNVIPTILPAWDRVCGDDGGGQGVSRGWFVVIAGSPGYGKTLSSLMLLKQSALVSERAGFISLEMHHHQLAARFYSIATGVPIHKLEKGRFDPEALDEVRRILRTMFPRGGVLTNNGLLFRLIDIIREMRMLYETKDVKTFVVDYLQLIGVGSEKELNEQITMTVTILRAFAVRTDTRVFLLSQFNRETSKNYLQSPAIQGCHGGQMIEACADQGLLWDHSRYDSLLNKLARTWALLGKNKHGARLEIAVEWDFNNLSIREAEPDEVEAGWTKADKKRLERKARPRKKATTA